MYVLLPIMSWLVLASHKRAEVNFWCIGGVLFGAGAILIGLRNSINPLLSYTLAISLIAIGLNLKITSLTIFLFYKKYITLNLTSIIIYIVVYEYYREYDPFPMMRFTISFSAFIVQLLVISYLFYQLKRFEKFKSVYWLFYTFAGSAVLNIIKLNLVWLGYSNPDISSVDADVILTLASAVLLAVFGNFAYVMMYLEKAIKESEDSVLVHVKQLERQRSIGIMSHSFAHELSQPLTSISLDLYDLKRSIFQSNSQQHKSLINMINNIESTVKNAIDLIGRIRNFSKPSTTNYKKTNLVRLARDVISAFSPHLKRDSVQIIIDTPTKAILECDNIEISQIFVNVVRNAIEAMENVEEKILTISINDGSEFVTVLFKDTGKGIDMSNVSELGTPFFTTKDSGLGIGFSISKSIAEKHNGTLTIENGKDNGALVTLMLRKRQLI